MSLSQPPLLQHWFAQLNPTLTNSIPDSPATTYNASWQTGFQLANKTPLASGGVAPEMEDVNGILAVLSQYAQYHGEGIGFTFNSTYATAMGGYQQGAKLMDTALTEHLFVALGTTTNDPDTATNVTGEQTPGGWDFFATRGPGTAFGFVMALSDHSTAANAIILHDDTYTAYVGGGNKPGAVVIWKQAISNTGACTLTVNGTAGTLTRADGTAVANGDLVAGTSYIAELVDLTLRWRLLSYLPSYLPVVVRAFGTDTTASVATTSTTGQMCGLAYAITPQSSGDVMINMSFRLQNSGAMNPSSATMELHHGTGTPPVNGAAPVGTLVGASMADSIATGASVHRSVTAVLVGLSKGTTYWFDLDIAIASANGTLVEVMFSAMEV